MPIGEGLHPETQRHAVENDTRAASARSAIDIPDAW
jgi:hypothetical protein